MKMTHAQFVAQLAKLAGLNGVLAYGYTAALINFKTKYPDGPRPMLDSTYRSNTEQDKLFAQGRSKPGKVVTYKRGGESKHNKFPAAAFDIKMVFQDGTVSWDEKYFADFAAEVERVGAGITWGGTFKTLRDLPHFEI